jgi:hypothetical protein
MTSRQRLWTPAASMASMVVINRLQGWTFVEGVSVFAVAIASDLLNSALSEVAMRDPLSFA